MSPHAPPLSWIAATWATALDLVLPRTCPGCGAASAWCHACDASIAGRPRQVEVPDATVERFSRAGVPLPPVHALSGYGGPVRRAIIAGKERGRRDLPPRLGAALGAGLVALRAIGAVPAGLWLVPAPTRRAAARARGGDPVTIMARAAARLATDSGMAVGVAPCLTLRSGARDSVGLDAAARAANLAGRVAVRPRAAPPSGARVVLLDDVMTTGATAFQAVATLHATSLRVAGVLVLAAVPARRPLLLPAASPQAE